MSRIRPVLFVLSLCLVHAGASAADSLTPDAFEKRWVVVLGSFPDVAAANRAAAERGEGLHVLASAAFTGFKPGYQVLVAGPFADRTEAQAAAGTVDKSARGYVKYTGALRSSGEPALGDSAPGAAALEKRALDGPAAALEKRVLDGPAVEKRVLDGPAVEKRVLDERAGGERALGERAAGERTLDESAAPGESTPEAAGPAQRLPKVPASTGPAFVAPDFLSVQQVTSLERWRRASEVGAGLGARYQILQILESFAGAAGGVLIRERITTPGRCVQGYRELEFAQPEGGIEVRTVSLLGQNCCPGTACGERTPGGLMLELFESGRDPAWAIDVEQGVLLDNMQGWSKRILRAQSKELEPFMAFDPTEDTFECPNDWSERSAHCFKYAAGKGYDFVWSKRSGGAVLERIVIAHRQ